MGDPPALFDVSRTTVAACPVCGAERAPDQEKAPDCRYDRERDMIDAIGKRPRGCLNAYDPAHVDIPY